MYTVTGSNAWSLVQRPSVPGRTISMATSLGSELVAARTHDLIEANLQELLGIIRSTTRAEQTDHGVCGVDPSVICRDTHGI